MSPRRELTKEELLVLGLVQELHGAHNTAADVFFADGDEACMSAKDSSGNSQIFVSLTNIGNWVRDGQITVEDARSWIFPTHTA